MPKSSTPKVKPKPKPTGKARGGEARASNLSAARRSEIAKKGAAARWKKEKLPQAICGSAEKPLRIAGIELDAYVLEDQTRVLTQNGFLRALGRKDRASFRGNLPPMLQSAGLEPFLTPELLEAGQPIHFLTPTGLRANGYRAKFLPQVCEVYLKARDARSLAPNQKPVAVQADILMRAFAEIGIIALVDEATGYQEVRTRNALAQILEEFIDKELQAWVRTFPDDFYREMFRLRGLEYPAGSVSRPQYFGVITSDIVYKRIAPGVMDELKRVKKEEGKPRDKLFQRLTSNLGYPKLREHLGSVVAIMKLSSDWRDFSEKLDRLHPRFGDTIPLPLEFQTDNGRGL